MTTLRQHLEAIREAAITGVLRNRAQAGETLEHAEAALKALDECDTPERWWIEGQGVHSADYRVRMLPDPLPGEPDPQAFP